MISVVLGSAGNRCLESLLQCQWSPCTSTWRRLCNTCRIHVRVSGIAMFMCCAPVCVMSILRSLCREGFNLFKQANKLFFADQDIY